MRTTVTIDGALFDSAVEAADPGTDTADLIREAIKVFARVQPGKRLVALGGKAPEMNVVPRRRPASGGRRSCRYSRIPPSGSHIFELPTRRCSRFWSMIGCSAIHSCRSNLPAARHQCRETGHWGPSGSCSRPLGQPQGKCFRFSIPSGVTTQAVAPSMSRSSSIESNRAGTQHSTVPMRPGGPRIRA